MPSRCGSELQVNNGVDEETEPPAAAICSWCRPLIVDENVPVQLQDLFFFEEFFAFTRVSCNWQIWF